GEAWAGPVRRRAGGEGPARQGEVGPLEGKDPTHHHYHYHHYLHAAARANKASAAKALALMSAPRSGPGDSGIIPPRPGGVTAAQGKLRTAPRRAQATTSPYEKGGVDEGLGAPAILVEGRRPRPPVAEVAHLQDVALELARTTQSPMTTFGGLDGLLPLIGSRSSNGRLNWGSATVMDCLPSRCVKELRSIASTARTE